MKLQSAIEFLSTYTFLFMLMTAALLFIALIISGSKSTIPQQCVSYGTITCNFVNYYINQTVPYALVTMSITNGQEVPINITQFSMSFGSANFLGGCAPNFLYPGQEATCAANVSAYQYNIGATADGLYAINALVCDRDIATLASNNTCTVNAVYTGSFVTSTTTESATVFSVMVAQSPTNNQLSANPVPPFLPAGYTPIENGDFELTTSGGLMFWDFATPNYLPGSDLDIPRTAFPPTLTALNNNNIASSAPYNSLFTYEYTVVYVPNPSSFTFNAEADDAITFFIKPANSLGHWTTTSYSDWSITSSPQYFSYTCACDPTNNKLVAIGLAWENAKAGGLQAAGIFT